MARVGTFQRSTIAKVPRNVCSIGLLTALLMHAVTTQEALGKCGTTYTTPSDLIWLTNNAADCADDMPCEHNIVAPADYVIHLNFTRLSGLGYSELKDGRNTYDLIDGHSNCQPRIEVTERYRESGDVLITSQKTLCYDRVFGSSVIIHTKSHSVVLTVFCLATKYSFFAMNFSFLSKPVDCSLECHGVCLQVNQICDGVYDCMFEEDEQDCKSLLPKEEASPTTKEHSSLATTSLALIFVSVAVVLAIFITMTVACICQRKLLPRQLNTTRGNSRMWEEEETPAALLQLTEQLLHTKNAQPCASAGACCTADSRRHEATEDEATALSVVPPLYNFQFTSHVKNSADGERGYQYSCREVDNANMWDRHVSWMDNAVPPNEYPFNHIDQQRLTNPELELLQRRDSAPPPYLLSQRDRLVRPPSYDTLVSTAFPSDAKGSDSKHGAERTAPGSR